MSGIFKKGLKVFLNNWVVIIMQFIIGVLIVKFVGAQGKGEVAILQTGCGVLSSLLGLGLSNSAAFYLRKQVYTENDIFKSYIKIVSIITLGFLIIFLLSYETMWKWLFDDVPSENMLFYIVFGYVVIMIFTQYFTSVALAKADIFTHRLMTLGVAILYLSFFFVFVIGLNLGVLGVMLSYLLSELVVCVYVRFRIKPNTNETPKDNQFINKSMISYGLKSHLVSLGNILFARLDYFFIAYYLSTTDVGVYSIALYFYQAGLTIPLAINGILLGEVAKNQSNSIPILLKSCFYIFVIMSFLVVIGLIIGKPFISFIYGDEFLKAIPSFYILLFAALFMSATSPFQSYFLGIGKPFIPGVITFFVGVIKIGALVILVPKFGILGNAWATLISVLFIVFLRILLFIKFSELSMKDLMNLKGSILRSNGN